MTITRTWIAAGAAGSLLAFSATSGLAADPANPDPNQTQRQPGMYEPGGAVQTDAQRDRDMSRDANRDDDRSWMEQVRDWWNSDQGEVKSVSGTIVDLETYLINGEDAARQQSANSSLHDNDPVALLTEGGDLYVLLDRYEQRMSGMAFNERRPGAAGAEGAGSPWTQTSREAKPGSPSDQRSATEASPNAGIGTSGGTAATRTDTGAAGRDMAKPGSKDFQTHKLHAGGTVTLSGNVYDRNGIKGLLVHGYTIESRAGIQSGTDRPGTSDLNRPGSDLNRPGTDDINRPSSMNRPGSEINRPGSDLNRSTPRPTDADTDAARNQRDNP